MNDINYYLEQAKIGYTFLDPKGDVTLEDQARYNEVFKVQREK